jgi:hypothetical protein
MLAWRRCTHFRKYKKSSALTADFLMQTNMFARKQATFIEVLTSVPLQEDALED